MVFYYPSVQIQLNYSVEHASVESAYTGARVSVFHTSAAASVSERQRSGDVS